MSFLSTLNKHLLGLCSILLIACGLYTPLHAEGTPNLRTSNGDPVLLFIGSDDFGNFASYDGPEESRLNFRIAEAGEVVYFGMSRLYQNSGTPENFGQYEYRVRSAADGSIVFGPITVNANNENLSTYEQAELGPAVITPGGYPTDGTSTFVAPAAGDYYVEFEQNRAGRARYIGLWDITVTNNNVTQNGRVYSKNWAFRVPELNPEQPECAFGAELSTVFYSYTADGFVTMIDFTDSGFQPLSFNLAFNRTGPGETGDLLIDRQSVADQNSTANAAEHLIFLSEPDATLFPDGQCGNVSVTGEIRCQGNETFCIPLVATLPGQAEIILDFNGNGVFDEGLDRIFAYRFTDMDNLEACVPWDGMLGTGVRPEEGATVDILVEYTQGVQHWALYDGEFMKNGFCVTPIRPLCGDGGSTPLYYDDSNITDLPGTGAPQRVLSGCECRTGVCRTWNNFEANANDACTVVDANTTGYGDKNTLNTWWFASSTSAASFDVPVEATMLNGPEDHCPGQAVGLNLTYNSANTINSIEWTGPAGPIGSASGQQNIMVTETGLYIVSVVDEFGCESTSEYTLMDVSCMLNISIINVECQDNGTDTDATDDVFFATITVSGENSSGFRYNGVTRQYGEEFQIGPFFVIDGDVTFTATDSFYDCCTESITIPAPMACSDGCAITSGAILERICMDNGTTTNPDDDLYTFTMIVDGINLSDRWISDRGDEGAYGVPTTFGPWPISAGTQNMTFTDSEDESCSLVVTVQPPMPCSNECELVPTVTNLVCSDNGTPFDPSDDTYTFDMSVAGLNVPSVAYSVDGVGATLYDQTGSFGPFPISGGDFTFLIADLGGAGCQLEYTLEETPTSCSDACGIDIADAMIVCDEDQNVLYTEVLVNNPNPNSTGWTSGNGTVNPYGEFVRVGTISPGGFTATITIADAVNPGCTSSVDLTSQEVSVSCPDNASEAGHAASLQTFGGELIGTGDFIPGDQEICWMQEETYGGEARYTERFTLQRTADADANIGLFSFYLYAPEGTQLLGAVFSQPAEEAIDCCNLTNDGAVVPSPTNPLSMPGLPDNLLPEGMELQQRFSVVLRANQVYSLMTSSRVPGTTGEFQWLIVSADSEELAVDLGDGPAPASTFESISAIYDLLNFEVNSYLNVSSSVELFGAPAIDDICGDYTIAFNDQTAGTCVSAQIQRSFDVDLGDTTLLAACNQTIQFRSLSLSDISWPENQLRFGCGDEFPMLENGHPSPAYTGYPYVYRGGVATMLDGNELDDLRIVYQDEEIQRADGGTDVIRTWTVADICRSTTATYDQLFKLESNGAPFLSCPVNNHYCPIVEEDIMLWAVGEFECTADITIPAPELNNVCDSTSWTFITEVLRITAAGDTVLFTTLELDDDRLIEGLEPGDYLLHYMGSNPTETIEDRYCRIRVADLTAPVAVCKTTVNLSIPGSGAIQVPVRVVNQGSYDNCGIETEDLRRRLPDGSPDADSLGWSSWTPRLIFDCEDVGTEIEVQLRLIDFAGNVNYCTSYITVTDNTDPYCTGLDEQFISCDDLPNNFSPTDTTQLRMLFGMPEVIDNCSAEAVELTPVVTGDICSPERIRRRFQAIDQHGNRSAGTFIQDINVTPSLNYAIRFPMDASTDCTDLIDTLLISGAGCDSITFAMVDISLPTEGDECRYIQRNFVVTNWCEWDGVSESIRINRDENCSGTEGDAEVWLVRTENGIFVDGDSEADNTFPAADSRGASCGGENPEGYWRQIDELPGGRYVYSQRIRIFDTVAPQLNLTRIDTICVDTSLCRAPVTIGIGIEDACQIDESEILIGIDYNSNGTVEATSAQIGTLEGSYPNYTYTVNLPIGDHRLFFTVTDDCGNTQQEEQAIRVNDCYVPALVCRDDRIYNLQPLLEEGDVDGDGIVEEAAVLVEAVDLAQCNFEDCSGELTFSINRVGEPYDRDQTSMFLDCDDRYEVYLEIYVWDQADNPFAVQPDGSIGGNNWRMCVVKVRLQDPNQVCNGCEVGGNLTINGEVSTVEGIDLEGVTVFSGSGHTVTNLSGAYQLGVVTGSNIVLNAVKEDEPLTGLSTLDMVLLQRHLSGEERITNRAQILSGDANKGGLATFDDIELIRQVFLGASENYPGGSPWRFIDGSWDGESEPANEITLTNLQECTFGKDFTAIRLGDVNGSYGVDAGAVDGSPSNEAIGPRLNLKAGNTSFSADEEVSVSFKIFQGADYAGGQAELLWDESALEMISVKEESSLTGNNFHAWDNRVRLSWSSSLMADEVITVRFRTKAAGQLKDHVRLVTDNFFQNELYAAEDLMVHPLGLVWTERTTTIVDTEINDVEGGFDNNRVDPLIGVTPNPIRNIGQLGLRLQVEQQVDISITDLNGRLMTSSSPTLGSGVQWVEINAEDWPAGVYLFTVKTVDGPLSGKIIRQ
ncbi:T9SS type A sorting domain-containing protein [Neolewinella agarilytica]|uniref:T9SS type A sorting domain-containing protein n=1 Tax=Neolewinella agarilytica TaxID=478744 RepID=UPI0023544A7D|nr:T9SS type A sorting domain-containing protein [Neolewinella agarilytica]